MVYLWGGETENKDRNREGYLNNPGRPCRYRTCQQHRKSYLTSWEEGQYRITWFLLVTDVKRARDLFPILRTHGGQGVPLTPASGEWKAVDGIIDCLFSQVEHVFVFKNCKFGWKIHLQKRNLIIEHPLYGKYNLNVVSFFIFTLTMYELHFHILIKPKLREDQ